VQCVGAYWHASVWFQQGTTRRQSIDLRRRGRRTSGHARHREPVSGDESSLQDSAWMTAATRSRARESPRSDSRSFSASSNAQLWRSDSRTVHELPRDARCRIKNTCPGHSQLHTGEKDHAPHHAFEVFPIPAFMANQAMSFGWRENTGIARHRTSTSAHGVTMLLRARIDSILENVRALRYAGPPACRIGKCLDGERPAAMSQDVGPQANRADASTADALVAVVQSCALHATNSTTGLRSPHPASPDRR